MLRAEPLHIVWRRFPSAICSIFYNPGILAERAHKNVRNGSFPEGDTIRALSQNQIPLSEPEPKGSLC